MNLSMPEPLYNELPGNQGISVMQWELNGPRIRRLHMPVEESYFLQNEFLSVKFILQRVKSWYLYFH